MLISYKHDKCQSCPSKNHYMRTPTFCCVVFVPHFVAKCTTTPWRHITCIPQGKFIF